MNKEAPTKKTAFEITNVGYFVDGKTYNEDGSWNGTGIVYGVEDGEETIDDFPFRYDPSAEEVYVEGLEGYSPDEKAKAAEILADNIKTNE